MFNIKNNLLVLLMATAYAFPQNEPPKAVSNQPVCSTSDQCTIHEPKNLEEAKIEVKEYYKSGKYEQDVVCITNQIRRYIESLQPLPLNASVVFDIDDTVICSLDYAIYNNFGYASKSYHKWEKNRMEPIKPMLELYHFLLAKGIKVFFVTARGEHRRKITQNNLTSAGFTKWEKVYLRPANDDSPSSSPYKIRTRRDIEAHGYKIIANIGDQESDLVGGYADRTFKLPNPMYLRN